MQGLVKYHGLRDPELRIPHHDSISVNLDALGTVCEVEFHEGPEDQVFINGAQASGREYERVVKLLDVVRQTAGIKKRARVVSENFPKGLRAKGLGFSSSAGAAIAAAAYQASGLADRLGWDETLLSRLARRFAGSACRTVVGGYARWFAGRDDMTSYAVRIGDSDTLPMKIVVVPLYIDAETEAAHREAAASPFFPARVARAQERVEEMERAIRSGDLQRVGELSEADSLELHAVTMTGGGRMILMIPESLRLVHLALALRAEGLPVYFSMQTGPTVYLDTTPDMADEVAGRVKQLSFRPMVSSVGGPAQILEPG
jgi:phosphomevalonate decarboxylase